MMKRTVGLTRQMAVAAILAFTCIAAAAKSPPVKIDFESEDYGGMFERCPRPEGSIERTTQKARSGKYSLRLTIKPQPLFGQPSVAITELNPKHCYFKGDARRSNYWSDDFERAEFWENRDHSPTYGSGAVYYGFSMWVEPESAPKGDYNRLVIGQWKSGCAEGNPCDYSPFLALRFMGGFFHITLDVDAKPVNPDEIKTAPKTCKMLLAFAKGKPSEHESEIPLKRDAQCDTRLEVNQLKPAEKITIEPVQYLPDPFSKWTDWVFRVQPGNKKGVIEVWNATNKTLIARATGKIGHKDHMGLIQYLKLGLYRDPANYPATVYIDNVSRGYSYDDVDPLKFK